MESISRFFFFFYFFCSLTEVAFKGMNWSLRWLKSIILSEKKNPKHLMSRVVLYDANVPQELFGLFLLSVGLVVGLSGKVGDQH